jgi:hypothetical protein
MKQNAWIEPGQEPVNLTGLDKKAGAGLDDPGRRVARVHREELLGARTPLASGCR